MSHQDRVFFGNFVAVLAFLVVAAFIFYFITQAVVDNDRDGSDNSMKMQAANENIKPIGQVVVADSSAPAAAAAPRTGAEVYTASCQACHGTGAAGAPKVGDKAAWSPRASKGLDGLLTTATNGLNAMPPKGTCGDCSPEELEAAIRHMLTETGIKVAGGDAPPAAPAAAPAAADSAAASASASPAAASAPNGKTVYEAHCAACHTTGAAGAPKLGDQDAWRARIAQGINTLTQHAINGFKAMPPRGACANCSDVDIRAAIAYMVDESN